MLSDRAPVGAVGAGLVPARPSRTVTIAGGRKGRPYGTESTMKVVGKQ